MHRRTVFLLAAYLFLRWILATEPGYTYDVQAYKRWAIGAAIGGVDEVYLRSDMDYPPLYAYILYPLAKVYLAMVPPDGETVEDSTLLTVLVKLPPLLFDLLMAGLLALWVRRRNIESPDRWTRWLPWIYLLNPVVLMEGAYWGQPDSIHSSLVLACFLWLGWARSAWPAWVLLALATLMKPLGAPFIPLLGILSLVRHGFRSTVVGGLLGLATAALIFLPFIVTGRSEATIQRVLGDVKAMSYTSTNAHNLWWLIGPWQNSEVPWLGPFTATHVAMTLFGIFYVGVLWAGHRLHRTPAAGPGMVSELKSGSGSGTESNPGSGPESNPVSGTELNPESKAELDPASRTEAGPSRSRASGITHPQMIGLALLVGLGFFILSTHMHENHMFITIPLLLPLTVLGGKRQRWVRSIFVIATVGAFLNLILHDLDFVETALITSAGSLERINPHLKRPFYTTEYAAIQVGTVLNVALFAYLCWQSFRPNGGWLRELGR